MKYEELIDLRSVVLMILGLYMNANGDCESRKVSNKDML